MNPSPSASPRADGLLSLSSTAQAKRLPMSPDNVYMQPPSYSDAPPLLMPPPPPELSAQHAMPLIPAASSVSYRPPDNNYLPLGHLQSSSSSRPSPSGVLPTLNMRTNGRATRTDRADQIRNAEQTAANDVASKIGNRVQQVIEKLSQKITEAELLFIWQRSCLKCKSATLSVPSGADEGKRGRREYSGAYYLKDIFCELCISELCDVCWRFANGKKRTEQQTEADFRRLCQRCECASCLCRCWVCTRHIQAEVRASQQQQQIQTTSVKDRIFNMCKNNVTADQSSRLSKGVYISSVERIYNERKTTLTLFKKLTHCWKNPPANNMPYSQKHKWTSAQYVQSCAAAWRWARCEHMLPQWLNMLRQIETKLSPVISDGRAIDVYRHCLRENLLPSAERNNSGKCRFPRIPSSEEARSFFAGKRIVVMGDSIGRHVYRDLIHLLQGNGPLPTLVDFSLRGDEQYANDICVYGSVTDSRLYGNNNPAQKLTQKDWYEHRIFYGPRQITVEYIWVNKVWNKILENDMKMLFDPVSYRNTYRLQRAPDVVIFNSALWDLTKYPGEENDTYRRNCASFAGLWDRIVADVQQRPSSSGEKQQRPPIFISYSTPKPGLKVTGDLVRDMSKDDRQQMNCDRKVRETRRYLFEALTRLKHAGASPIGFVDIYDASERLQLDQAFRFADGIHYDPPALRIFTSMIVGEYIKLSDDVSWPTPLSTASSSSSSKRGTDGELLNSAGDDSVRTQWLNKCHDLLSAVTMSYYITQSQPIANIAHAELHAWLNANPHKRDGMRNLEFFPIGAKMVKLWTVYPLPELPRIMARLYAATAAMLDNMGRLMLIRHATSQPADAVVVPTKAITWSDVAKQCKTQLENDVGSIIHRVAKKPNMVHYGALNGFYANEFYIRISCVMQILRYSEYAIPLYRFIRDSCDPEFQKRVREEFGGAGGTFSAQMDIKAIQKHVETGEAQITVHASASTHSRPLKERLLQEDEYANGHDLAQLLYSKAKQPSLSTMARGMPLKKTTSKQQKQQPANKAAAASKQQQKVKGRNSSSQQQETVEFRRARPKFFRARFVNEEGEEEDVEELEEDTDDDEDDLDDDQYIIANILDVRVHLESWSDDGLEYLVAWKKYPGEDTWEPIQNLDNCQELIDAFNKREGIAEKKERLNKKRIKQEAEEKREEAAAAAAKAARQAARANGNGGDINADLQSDSSSDVAAPILGGASSSKQPKSGKFNDVKSMQAHFSGSRATSSSKSSSTRDGDNKPLRKTITKKKPDDKAAKKRKKMIESDDDENKRDDKEGAKKDISDKNKKKKQHKKDKKRGKKHKHKRDKKRKEEKEERRKLKKKEKREKAENSADIKREVKQEEDAEHPVTIPNGVYVPGQQQLALPAASQSLPHEYSAAWRDKSIARGVREQRKLQEIICLLPGLAADRRAPASELPNGHDSSSNNEATRKELMNAADIFLPLPPAKASENDADNNRSPSEVEGALVMWEGSDAVESVEIGFLLDYYRKHLLEAFLKFAKFSRKPLIAPPPDPGAASSSNNLS